MATRKRDERESSYVNKVNALQWPPIFVALIVGAIIGLVIGKSAFQSVVGGVMNNSSNTASAPAFSTGSNIRVATQILMREHAVVGAQDLVALYDGKDTSQLDTLMNDNTSKLTSFVESAYGKDKAQEFSMLWMKHMDDYKKYVQAKQNGDDDGMSSAKSDLSKVASDLGKLLGTDNLNSDHLTDQINQHIAGTLAIVDAHAGGDTAKEATLMKQGYDQAGTMADMIVKGVLLDHPNMDR